MFTSGASGFLELVEEQEPPIYMFKGLWEARMQLRLPPYPRMRRRVAIANLEMQHSTTDTKGRVGISSERFHRL